MEPNERNYSRRAVTHEGDRQQRVRSRREVSLRGPSLDEASIGELVDRITSDASRLVRLEATLARAEVKEARTRVKEMATRFAIAGAFGVSAAVALTAFLVIALAEAIDSWSASALIVGVALLVGAWILGRAGLARVADGKVGLPRTAASLAEGARWGKEELRAFKREFTA
jgi:Putative Actinobacterial Holin-X, holin superfamily III